MGHDRDSARDGNFWSAEGLNEFLDKEKLGKRLG